MKKLILVFAILPLMLSNNTVDNSFNGVWQEAIGNEFVRFGVNAEFETVFQRLVNNKMAAYGTIEKSEGTLLVNNKLTGEEYELIYAFSPSGNTVAISKPHSSEAWVFFRVGN